MSFGLKFLLILISFMRTTVIIALLFSVLCHSYAQNIEVVTEELCSPDKIDETFTWCMNGALNRIPYRLNYPWNNANVTKPICEQSGPTSSRLYDDCYAIEKVAFGELENASMPNNEFKAARLLFILTTNHQVIIKELNTELDIFRKTLKGTTDFHNDGMFSIQLGSQKVALIFSDYDAGTNIVWIVYSDWIYREYIWTIPAEQGCSPIIISTTAFVINVDTIDIVNSVKQCGRSYLYFSKKINGELDYYKRILIDNDDPNSAVKVKHIEYHHGTGSIDYLVLHDTSRVHILAHSDLEQVDSIDWRDPARLTTFFLITENEEGEKITNLSPLVLPTRSGLNNFWLAIGYTNSRAINSLKLVLLADFNQLDPSRVRINNPAGKSAPCANPNFYRTPDRRCQQRFSYDHSINIANDAKIEAVEARNIKPVELVGSHEESPNLGLALFHDHMKSNTSYTAIFVAAGRRLWVLGLSEKQFENDYGGQIMFDEMITYLYIGKINSMAVSENGMHVFASMSRSNYELQSMQRTAEACKMVWVNHNQTDFNHLYAMYWENEIDFDCDRANSVTLNEFVQYASLCPSLGAYCYSFSANVFRGVTPGYYTVNSYQELLCDPGSYCPGGLGMKLPCPAGYQCPTKGLTAPLICPASSAKSRTCYIPGSIRPYDCTDGNVCITAYTTPVPAPPGYYTASLLERREFQNLFKKCELGEYCPLARSIYQDRLCPENHYCLTPELILPSECPCEIEYDKNHQVTGGHCSYCPGGQYAPDDCPAGFYCASPFSKVACQQTTYCPNGTKIPLLCPPGYYCPRPDIIIQCPEGSFCPIGSITYTRCSPFVSCPPGTQEESGFEVLIFSAIIVVFTVGAWFGVKKWKAYKKKQAEMRMAAMKQSSDKLTTVFKEKTFKVNIAFKDLALSLKKGDKKRIISETSGVIRASKLTAILGPSGAGKTAFLETLAGKAHYGEMQGDVFINGVSCHIHHLKRLMGYVPPDDIMHHDLTVKQVLRFSADLRLPRTTSSKQKDEIVDSIIKLLRLTDVKDDLIGNVSYRGISGGQRKRVNIGIELVADPTILFLDEPTSGLDSNNGMEVVKMLKKISRLGLTVLAIIHQPRYDIFSMFDEVILFGRGGRILYMGPSKEVLPYFKNLGYECPTHQNPADFVLDVICGEVKAKGKVPVDLLSSWKDHFEKEFDEKYKPFFPLPNEVVYENNNSNNNNDSRVSLHDGFIGDNSQEMTSYKLLTSSSEDLKPALKYNKTKPPKRQAASFLRQIWLFGWRFFLQQVKDVFTLISDVLLVLISAIMFGLLFQHANYIGPPPESTCQSLINKDFVERCLYPLADPFPQMALLTGIGLALPAAIAAIRIFSPEKQIYFRESSAGGSTLAYFIGKDLAFLPWSFALPLLYLSIWGAFVRYRGNFGYYYLIYVLIYWISASIGEIGGIALKSKLTSIFTVVAIFVMAMFAGVLPSNREIERLGIGEVYYGSFFRYSTEAFYVTEISKWQAIYDVESGLKLYNFNMENFTRDMIVLACYGIGLRIIAYVLMVVLNREKKR